MIRVEGEMTIKIWISRRKGKTPARFGVFFHTISAQNFVPFDTIPYFWALQTVVNVFIMTKAALLTALLVFAGLEGYAQKTAPVAETISNIVPNPGFERFGSPPIGWSYKGTYFGQVVKYWFSPTSSSPDVYGPGVSVPRDWADKGFGDQKTHSGKSMAGLTLYGCLNGKPHCREYVSIQLSEPLVPGQTYLAEFWVSHLKKSMQINSIGAYFSEKRENRLTDELLAFKPQVKAVKPVEAPEGKWVKISGQFKAADESEYLTIGNFSHDTATVAQNVAPDGYNYAYYYIDDILVKKVPPYLPVPVKADDLTRLSLEPGKPIRLKNIYFEFDKDELMPRSYVELKKLLQIMRDHPSMIIAISGHTDGLGSDTYNLELSRRRAKAVADFLIENKIALKRLSSKGEGESKPVATNETEEGRQLNRRVEFVVVAK